MSESSSPDAPRRLLTDLCRLVAERAAVEEEVNAGFAARNEAAEKEYQEAQRLLDERYRAEKAAAEAGVRRDAHARPGQVRVGTRRAGEGVRIGPGGSARPIRRRPGGRANRRCRTRIGRRWRPPTRPAAA